MKTQTALRSIVALMLGPALLWGCAQPVKAPEPPPPAPRIISFSASKAKVPAGEKVTLSWTTENAESVELKDAFKGVPSGFDGAKSGSIEVTVTEDALYILTVANARGVRDSAAVAVQVEERATNVLFLASPRRVTAGEPAVLAWTAKGARSVSIKTSTGEAIDLGGQLESGAVEVRPMTGTGYVLTVDGTEHQAGIDVRPVINVFQANAPGVVPGDSVTLQWLTLGATKLTLTREGVGEMAAVDDVSKVADGSFSEMIPKSVDQALIYSYVLRAEGTSAESFAEARISVFVAGAPAVTKFDAPPYAKVGGTFPLSWETTGATEVEVLKEGVVIYKSPTTGLAAKGSVELPTPAMDTTFRVRALDGRGGVSLSDPKLVNPVGAPTITKFEATPQPGVANGGDAVTLDWDAPNARHLIIQAKGGTQITELTGMQAQKGTWSAYPNKDTTYVLLVDNTLGDKADPAESAVTVTTPAQLVFNPPASPAGTTIQVTGSTVSGGGDIIGLPISALNQPGEAFVDISGTGTDAQMMWEDSAAHLISLPETFTTRIFGTPVSNNQISISPNGWFAFKNTAANGPNQVTASTALPSAALEPFAIAPFWTDIYVSGGAVYYKLDGTGDQRRLIVQWEKVAQLPYSWPLGGPLTFQAQVYASGKIVFAYKDLSNLRPATTTPVSVGVVNGAETDAVVPSAMPNTGDTLTFFDRVTTLPVSMKAPLAPFTVRQLIGTDGFIEIETNYPAIKPNDFVITEANVNSPVANGQWFEVYNSLSVPIDLGGWTLDFGGGQTQTIAGSLIVPANGYALFAQQPGAGDGLNVDYVWGTTPTLAPGATLRILTQSLPFASMTLPSGAASGYSWIHQKPKGMVYKSGLSGLTCAPPAAATYGTYGQHGTPRAANTTSCTLLQYQGTIPGNFESILSTGTKFNFTDTDASAGPLTMPVPVSLDGVTYNTIYVGSNGWISLNPKTCSGYPCADSNRTAPGGSSDVGFIALYWDDLEFIQSTGGVYWQRRVPGLAPNDGYTIVSWENFRRYGSWNAADNLNFQAKFFDDGRVELHYGTLLTDFGSGATTWWELMSGNGAFVININNNGLQPNSAYRFIAK